MFYAELNEFLTRELANDGYAGVEVRVTPARTEYVPEHNMTAADNHVLGLSSVLRTPRTSSERRAVASVN